MKILALVLLTHVFYVATVSTASANGNRVGNGGDVVTCSQSTELLDFYENLETVKKFESSLDRNKVLDTVLTNLERLNPKQAKQYKKRAQEFETEAEFKTDIALTDVKDSKHLFQPKDKSCELQQIALRRHLTSARGKRFVIDKDLWNKLSERSKAGLILHEIVYEHLYKLNEDDSVKARELNAYLFSDRAFADSAATYWKMIAALNLPIYK